MRALLGLLSCLSESPSELFSNFFWQLIECVVDRMCGCFYPSVTQ